MKNLTGRVILVVAIGLAVGGAILLWQRGQSRKNAMEGVAKLANALANHQGSDLLDTVLIPLAIQSRTQSEQQEFITKALADEISPSGVEALKHHAKFGPLKSMFPNEALEWCSQTGVNADDCVAFKMERGGVHAEVVLLHEGQTYRVIRCNNVKQMAMEGRRS